MPLLSTVRILSLLEDQTYVPSAFEGLVVAVSCVVENCARVSAPEMARVCADEVLAAKAAKVLESFDEEGAPALALSEAAELSAASVPLSSVAVPDPFEADDAASAEDSPEAEELAPASATAEAGEPPADPPSSAYTSTGFKAGQPNPRRTIESATEMALLPSDARPVKLLAVLAFVISLFMSLTPVATPRKTRGLTLSP